MSNNLSERPRNMMDRFDNFMRDSFHSARSFIAPDTLIIDVKDTGNKYEIAVDLPGVDKDNISLSLDNGRLTVTAEKKSESESDDEQGRFLHRERFHGTSSRSVYLPDLLPEGKPKATFENGVLSIVLEKAEAISTSNKIEIE